MAKSVSDAIKSGMEAFEKLGKFVRPANLSAQIDLFAQSMNEAMMKLQAVALHYDAKGLEITGQFGEASSKVFGGLNSAFDLFSKLAESGSKVLDGPARLVTLANSLSQKTVIVMNTLGGMIPGWDEFASTKIGQFSEATGKAFTGLSSAFDFFTKIAESGEKVINGPAKLASLSVQLAEKTVIVMNNLGGMIPLWNEFASTKIGQFGEATGKVFGGLSGAFDLFAKLADTGDKVISGPARLASLAVQLAEKTVIVANELGALIPLWNDVADTKVGQFGEATGKVFAGLSGAFDLFTKLAESGADVLNGAAKLASLSVQLAEKVVIVMNNLGGMIPLWDEFGSTKVGQFGEATGKVFGGLTSAFDLFAKLAERGDEVLNGTTRLAAVTSQLAQKVVIVMNNLGAAIPLWDEFASTKIGLFAEATGKVFAGLNSAFDFFSKIKELDTGAMGAAVDSLFTALGDVLTRFKVKSEEWKSVATKQAADVATNIGTVMDALGRSVDAVTKIIGFKGEKGEEGGFFGFSLSRIKAGAVGGVAGFFAVLDQIIREFAERSAEWKSRATPQITQVATNIGTVMDALGRAVDTVKKIVDFKGGSGDGFFGLNLSRMREGLVGGVQGFFSVLDEVLAAVSARANSLDSNTLQKAVDFSTALGEIFTNIQKGFVDFTDKKNVASVTAIWREGLNDIFQFTNSVWAPQLKSAFNVWFEAYSTYFREYTAEWVRIWQEAMASLTPPPLPGSDGSGPPPGPPGSPPPPPPEWDGPRGPSSPSGPSGPSAFLPSAGGGGGPVYNNCVIIGDAAIQAEPDVVEFLRRALIHKQGTGLGPDVVN